MDIGDIAAAITLVLFCYLYFFLGRTLPGELNIAIVVVMAIAGSVLMGIFIGQITRA